jgi:hypothetical protein
MSENCPINEQTADGTVVGRCWMTLSDGVCPRHGDVQHELDRFRETGHTTVENLMRKRKGLPTFPPDRER